MSSLPHSPTSHSPPRSRFGIVSEGVSKLKVCADWKSVELKRLHVLKARNWTSLEVGTFESCRASVCARGAFKPNVQAPNF